MALAVHDLRLLTDARRGGVSCSASRAHWQTGEHLVIDGQVIRVHLVRALVVRALDHTVLRKLFHALKAE